MIRRREILFDLFKHLTLLNVATLMFLIALQPAIGLDKLRHAFWFAVATQLISLILALGSLVALVFARFDEMPSDDEESHEVVDMTFAILAVVCGLLFYIGIVLVFVDLFFS